MIKIKEPQREPARHILTSVAGNIRQETWQLSSRDLPGKFAAPWSIRKYTLHGGKQEGVDLVEIESGPLRILVSPTRGMSVIRVERGDIRLGWDSPVKEIVHPREINLQNRGGLGWLEGFNEWMVRCGLEWAGHPGKDRFVNNTGEVAEMDLTLHGRIGNIPASEVEVIVDPQPPHRIRLRGRVDERQFYGPKLELWTEISVEPGATSFRIDDQIRNYSSDPQEFELIYHANFGPPLLGPGSRFIGAIREVTPFNDHAAKSTAGFASYDGPTKGFVEQVYVLQPFADEQGSTTVMLSNQAGDRAVTMRYHIAQLPYFTLWKNLTTLEEGYVTGLEPGTSSPANRGIERQAGRVPKLLPGEIRKFGLELAIQAGVTEVSAAAAPIERLRASRRPTFNSKTIR
jgi:hypothetical protein